MGLFGTFPPCFAAVTAASTLDSPNPKARARPAGDGAGLAARWLLVAFAAAAIFEVAIGLSVVPRDGLLDPDSYMRLVRIRDGLRVGGFTHVVAADNGGSGTVIYWSHLLDALVLALYAPLRLVGDQDAALRLAAASVGPLVAGLLAAACLWVPAPLSDRRWLWLAPVVTLLSPGVMSYGAFGWVHHHLPLALAAIVGAGFAGRAAAGCARAGAGCGLAAAVGIWLSPEAVPYVLLAIGAIGMAWCIRPDQVAAALRCCATAFCLGTLAALMVDPPAGGRLSQEIDCLSAAYAVLALLVGGALWLLTVFGRVWVSVPARLLAAGLAGFGSLGLWLLMYPAVVHGYAGLVPAEAVPAYFGAIAEMQPQPDLSTGLRALLPGALTVVLAAGRAWTRRSPLWAYAAAAGLVVIGFAAFSVRFVVYAEVMAGAAAPIAVSWASAATGSPARARLLRAGALALFTVVPATMGVRVHAAEEGRAESVCSVAAIAPALRQLPGAVVLTGISDTPEILWRSPVRTVGSLYHRSIDAFLRARAAWRSGPSAAVPDAVLRTGATHILACGPSARTLLVDDLPPDTLEDRLGRQDVPPWLQEVARAGGYRLYQVVRGSP